MLKKNLFFIVLFCLSSIFNIASSDIIPIKKPLQPKDVTEKKLLIDVLRPLPKPIKKTETKKLEKEIVVKKDIKKSFILPKKKPLIAGTKKTKEIKISKYYSTSKSKLFVNGLLDNFVKTYGKEGRIKKVGKGLV